MAVRRLLVGPPFNAALDAEEMLDSVSHDHGNLLVSAFPLAHGLSPILKAFGKGLLGQAELEPNLLQLPAGQAPRA